MIPVCPIINYDESNPETEPLLQRELQKISDWLITNRLTINVIKSNYLIFSTGKKKKLRLTINNETLLEKEFTKYLGVVIDNKLTWNQHITQTNLRLSKGIGTLYNLRRYVPQVTLKSLYFAFVQSNINYAAATNIKSIKTSLNKAVRTMAFKECRHATNIKPINTSKPEQGSKNHDFQRM